MPPPWEYCVHTSPASVVFHNPDSRVIRYMTLLSLGSAMMCVTLTCAIVVIFFFCWLTNTFCSHVSPRSFVLYMPPSPAPDEENVMVLFSQESPKKSRLPNAAMRNGYFIMLK